MRFIWIMVALCAIVIPPVSVHAQDRALHWERYDVAVVVGGDGTMRVTETQHLVIDQGTYRTGSRSFTTGDFGRVRSVSVSEDGESYVRGSEQPGTFSASDDGEQFNLRYVFRDPTAVEHTMTISYVVTHMLGVEGDDAVLQWSFFCADTSCPRIEAGSLTLQLPAGVNRDDVSVTTSGVETTASVDGNRWRWQLADAIQGQQVALTARFPRSALAASAVFRSGDAGAAALPDRLPSTADQPSSDVAQPSVPGSGFSLTFCVVGIFMLILLFSLMSSSARRRGTFSGPRTPTFPLPPMGGGYGFPRRRRFRRGYGRGYGGWGIPPIIPPLPPSWGDRTPWNGPSAPPRDNDSGSGGGGFSWDNSGGGGSSWDNSGGGGSSWGDSGGGGSSWGDSGGGGGSSGGGGSNDRSSFN